MNIYWESFRTFFKIGIFTLGCGYAMIPLIEEEVVNKKQWVSKDEMLDLIAIAQSCPGVFAINIATFIGYKLNKVRGAIATTVGTALPSFLIILAIAIFHRSPAFTSHLNLYSIKRPFGKLYLVSKFGRNILISGMKVSSIRTTIMHR